ncbi:MAG: hypothetical protein WC444_07265 [Candidatus Paceibacterota bacterium]
MAILPVSLKDDSQLFIVKKDLSGGVNTRQNEQILSDNQSTVLTNVNLDVQGERSIRPGNTLIEDLSNNAGTGLFGFEPDGGSNELLVTEDTNLWGWAGSGSFTKHKDNFTTNLATKMIKAGESGEGDVVLITNGTDNVFRMKMDHTFQDLGNTSGTGSDSPPKSRAITYFRNRVWILKENCLYYSSAFPTDYSTAFDTVSNFFYVPCGTTMGIAGIRDQGILCFGTDSVWGINPSSTPVATDKPERLFDIGCAAWDTICQVGDDVLYLAYDGVRQLYRNIQDKLQTGSSYPISYLLKTQYDNINWAYINKASAIYWDNKYFISLPTGSSTYNNEVWIYYVASKSWAVISGWNVARFAKLKIGGQERLYGVDSTDGSVYRLWYGTSDNGTAISYTEEGRAEDFGKPLQYKYGGEVKIRANGGTGTVIVSVNLDGEGYQQLGSISLATQGITFPVTFPLTFTSTQEVHEEWHLDSLGRFKKIKPKISCSTLNATLTVIELIMTTYADEYEAEE